MPLGVSLAVGVFDVSHMTVVDVDGAGASDFLRRLLANDVARLAPGQALTVVTAFPSDGVTASGPLLRERDRKSVV